MEEFLDREGVRQVVQGVKDYIDQQDTAVEQHIDRVERELGTKVNQGQIATREVPGLVRAFEYQGDFHIWTLNPDELNYTVTSNPAGGETYDIRTLNYRIEPNAAGGETYIFGEGGPGPGPEPVNEVSIIGDMTNWDTDIYFTKVGDLQYSLSNYSFDYENYSLPFFAIRINENFNYSSTNYTNINYEFQDFPNNNDYSSYFTRFNTGESIQCLKGCKVNISVVLDSNTRQGFANSTITFTWLQDIAEPTFAINSLDLVGTQNDFTFGQTPFTLDSGSASGQGTWVLSNNSFSQDDHFLFAVNGGWNISGGRDWSNFIFSNFPNNNDYSSYLQAPGEPPMEDNTAVLQSFVGTVTISVDAEQVKTDRNLSSATITITYEGEN